MRQEGQEEIIIDWTHKEGWDYLDICDCCGTMGNRGAFLQLDVNDISITANVCLDKPPTYTIYHHTTEEEFFDLTQEEAKLHFN